VGPVVSEAFNTVYELNLGRRKDLDAFEIGSESPKFRSSVFYRGSGSRLHEFAQVPLQNRSRESSGCARRRIALAKHGASVHE